MKVVAIWIVMITCTGLAHAQIHAPEFPRFTIEPGRTDKDDLPLSGARLCILPKGGPCFQMLPERAKGSNEVVYQFGLTPQSERLPLKSGGSVVFFTATFSGGGSGLLERLALLRSQPDGTILNLLPYVAVTDQSDRQMATWPEISELPILIMADFVWGEGETHFAPHFYQVEVYQYDAKTDRYAKTLTYTTLQRYDGLDSTNRVHVIQSERKKSCVG